MSKGGGVDPGRVGVTDAARKLIEQLEEGNTGR